MQNSNLHVGSSLQLFHEFDLTDQFCLYMGIVIIFSWILWIWLHFFRKARNMCFYVKVIIKLESRVQMFVINWRNRAEGIYYIFCIFLWLTGARIVDPEEAEEDKFRDILLILDLLINLMSKDLVDFGLSGRIILHYINKNFHYLFSMRGLALSVKGTQEHQDLGFYNIRLNVR